MNTRSPLATFATAGEASERTPDAIDRIKELLNSSIDVAHRQAHVLSIAVNRVTGPRSKEAPANVPQSPLVDRSIYQLLDELSRALDATDEELARLREQMP